MVALLFFIVILCQIMPRKATPQSPDVQNVIARIKSYCKSSNTCIFALSRAAGVSQSALTRFINGERKTITPTASKCLAYVNYQHNWHNWHNGNEKEIESFSENGYNIIENAAKSLWDGDPRTVEFVASIIRTLKPAVEIAMMAFKGSNRGIDHDH